jgi:hypothetical protein
MLLTAKHNLGFWKPLSGAIILLGSLLVAIQCNSGETPTPIAHTSPPPEVLNFTLGSSGPVFTGEEISIQANIRRNGHSVAYQWVVEAGKGEIISGNGTPLITYKAPNTPGTYRIDVELQYDGDSLIKRSIVVEVLSKSIAEPSDEPTTEPTEKPTLEPTEEPTVEPTEEPTLEPTEEPTEEPTKEPVLEQTPEAVVVSVKGLNLRTGPGTEYPILSAFAYNDILEIQGRVPSDGWIQVVPANSNTTKGWVIAGIPYTEIHGV